MEFVVATERSLDQITALLAASFEGHAVNIQFSVGLLLGLMRTEGIDLGSSLIIRENGEDVGFAMVARRGPESRVAGFGIVTAARGRGTGHALLERVIKEAISRGDHRMVLECNEENLPARRLYERQGFVIRRRLLGFSATSVVPCHQDELDEISIYEAVMAVTRAEVPDLPWQISPASLLQAALPTVAYRLGPSSAILTPTATGVQLRAIVTEPGSQRQGRGRRLIQAIAARHPDLPWSVSPLWPEENVTGFLEPLGFVRTSITQCQMDLKLGS